MHVEQILDRLEGVRAAGHNKYVARCPAHNDRNPSLSIGISDNKILIYCASGCHNEDIVLALGIKMRNLFIDESYGAACSVPLKKKDYGVDQVELDRTVMELAATDIAAGKQLSIEDTARVMMAKRRLSYG